MLSEPCFRDHFNKEMLTKLSPTLISVVARKKMGHVVEKIPFYAHTVQRTGGYPKGQRVLVHDREWERGDEEEMSVINERLKKRPTVKGTQAHRPQITTSRKGWSRASRGRIHKHPSTGKKTQGGHHKYVIRDRREEKQGA